MSDESNASLEVAERVTVNLSHRSVDALETAARLTGDTKTEVINKALQAYAIVKSWT